MQIRVMLIVAALAAACSPNRQDGSGVVVGSSASSPDTTAHVDTAQPPSVDTSHATGGVTVTLDHDHYAQGGTINMRIVNGTSDQLGFNSCTNTTLERQQGGAWTQVAAPTGRMCAMYIQLIRPHETASASWTLPPSVDAGTYRLVESFSVQRAPPSGAADATRAESPAFRVP